LRFEYCALNFDAGISPTVAWLAFLALCSARTVSAVSGVGFAEFPFCSVACLLVLRSVTFGRVPYAFGLRNRSRA
jgi:hypothetical protein